MSGTMRTLITLAAGLAVGAMICGPAAAGVVSATIVAAVGDPAGGSTISSVNSPFTDGNGRVGFVAALADARRMIWYDTGPVFFSDQALPLVLTGGEGTMGVSNTGGFVYSPSADGNDAVYTHNGLLLARQQDAPGFPGQFNSFNSRPRMTAPGTAWWIAGVANTPTGSSVNRVLYRADGAQPANIQRVLAGGDVIGGFTILTTASNFDFDISDNNAHHIHVLDTTEASASNQFLYVDGAMLFREGTPTGSGGNWIAFDTPGINNSGNYIFSGDTDLATTMDMFLAYNGTIMVREGDTIDGYTIASGSAVRAASINNNDMVAYIWGTGTNEALFAGPGPTLATSSLLLLQTGDVVDTDGDSIPDWQVFDFKASSGIGPGLDIAQNGFVFVEVGLGPIGGTETMEAIIRVAIPEPASASLLMLAALMLRRRRR